MGKLRVHNIEAQTGTNVDLGAAGDVVTFASDSLQTNLYKDSGGNTLFQSDGAGTLSNVNSGLSGAGPKLILSQTATNEASVSFTSGIDSTYDKYMFVFINIEPATDWGDFQFTVSTNGGTSYGVTKTTTFFEAAHAEADTSAYLSYDGTWDRAQSTSPQWFTYNTGTAGDYSYSGIMNFYSPSSTTYVKQFTITGNNYYGGDYSMNQFVAGYINTTSAVDAIKFQMDTGNIENGTIKLYGVT
jgi:hypothetical protein